MKEVRTLQDLQGERLSSVTFVMDYLQLGFNGPTINAYSRPIAEIAGNRHRFPESGSRDAICSFIGHDVVRVIEIPNQRLVLSFEMGTIEIPLDPVSQVHGDDFDFIPSAASE